MWRRGLRKASQAKTADHRNGSGHAGRRRDRNHPADTSSSPEARIVVFTMRDHPFIVTRVLRAGVLGYVTKTSPPRILLEAVKRALTGGVYLSQDIAQAMALSNMDIRHSSLASLTRRELEIFRMLSEGRSSSEIAETLPLSQKSVANYSLRVKQKLGMRNVAELVRLALSEGLNARRKWRECAKR